MERNTLLIADDIAVCKDGNIAGYTMTTTAGDEITETLMKEYLIDFDTAEQIKMDLDSKKEIYFTDIMGFEQTLPAESVLERVSGGISHLCTEIAESIIDVNGGPPSAVFLAGGGSKLHGVLEGVREALQMDEKRIAIAGNNFKVTAFSKEYDLNNPEYATPLGIAVSSGLNLINDSYHLTLNGKRARLSSYTGGGAYTVSGSTVFYGNKAPNDPKTAMFKISGNTPSADVFVRNSSGTSSTKSEATLQGFDELLTKETAMGNITYKLAHTNPATQKYGYVKNVSSAYSVGYYSTKAVGDCVYLSTSGIVHEASGSGNVVMETTLERAVTSAKAENFNEIYVCGTVNITKEDEEILNNSGITFKRCSECTNTVLFHIEKGEDVTFNGIKIDGDKILSTAALVSVAGTLTIDGESDCIFDRIPDR